MEIIQLIIAISFMTLVYNIGQLFFRIKTGVSNQHYFLGFNSKLVDFKISGVKFSLGVYIPIFPFARIYKIEDGEKQRLEMPWELHQFSLRKRWLVTLSGTLSLIVSGIIIFIITTYFEVEQYISKAEINKHGIYPSELAKKSGFESGDSVLSFNGKDFEDFAELIIPKAGDTYLVSHNGKTRELRINEETAKELNKPSDHLFLYLKTPLEIKEIMSQSPAYEAGLMNGDRIESVNGVPILKQFELKNELLKDNDKVASLRISRIVDGKITLLDKEVKLNENGLLGIFIDEKISYSTKTNSIFEAVVKGLEKSYRIIILNLTPFFEIRSPKKMGSFSTMEIGPAYQEGIQWHKYWVVTGTLTMAYAFISLLPFPRSIFPEVIALTYEGITRRTFSFKAYKILNKLGYIFLVLLVVGSIIYDMVKYLL